MQMTIRAWRKAEDGDRHVRRTLLYSNQRCSLQYGCGETPPLFDRAGCRSAVGLRHSRNSFSLHLNVGFGVLPTRMTRATQFRLIETEDDIRAGIRALRRKCEAARRMHDVVGDPPLRRFTPDFEALARIVVGQQLSIA